MLATGKDQLHRERTAVCCLASVNIEKFDEWKDDAFFIPNILKFLDNVLQYFIDHAPCGMENARYSAMRERSIGLGIMGAHSYIQRISTGDYEESIEYGDENSQFLLKQVMMYISDECGRANISLAQERGSCPDAQCVDEVARFTHVTAIAPTASISIICNTSPGVDPIAANAYTSRTLDGTFSYRNPVLERLLEQKYCQNNEDVWSSIIANNGSVQHLDFMEENEKRVFRTAYELDQKNLIQQVSVIQKFVDQSISTNLFVAADISKKELHELHFSAWEMGLKSLYYLRSKSVQRAQTIYQCEKDVCDACQ
jgi:ribonucleoside-diphosphate reductase alpha chain